jgi:hypothetical protein
VEAILATPADGSDDRAGDGKQELKRHGSAIWLIFMGNNGSKNVANGQG